MNPLRLVPLGARLAAAFAILAAALLVVGLVGVSASRSLDLSLDLLLVGPTAQGAAALVSALGLNAQASAHEVVRHLYVYDGDLQNEDVIAWRVGQRNAQVAGELRRIRPLVTDARTKGDLARLAGAPTPSSRRRQGRVALAPRDRPPRGRADRSASRNAYIAEVMPALEQLETTRSALARDLEAENRAALAATAAKADRGQRTILIVIALALALSAAMAFVITRSITRPVAVLRRACTA